MILKDIYYIDKEFKKVFGQIKIENGKFEEFAENDIDLVSDDVKSMDGLLAIAGMVDIHTHGGNGADTCDDLSDSMDVLSQYYAKHGVTSFCPTTMTVSNEKLKQVFQRVENYKGNEKAAYIHGINMEGPYVSLKKCGAQNVNHIRPASVEEFEELNAISKISLVDVAPETEDALEFSKKVSKTTTVSIAHTNANYDEAVLAFDSGFTHATHFMNAMSGFESRSTGTVGAILENNKVTAELICDGYHLAPSTVRLLFKLLGDERCVVVSDSLSCAGRPDGEYALGGQEVIVKDGKAHLKSGTIAGSSSNLFEEFKNLLSFGIPFESALKACTINPCKAIGVDNVCGSIEVGKNADMLFIDKQFNLRHVMIKGEFIF